MASLVLTSLALLLSPGSSVPGIWTTSDRQLNVAKTKATP
jgi:hypothetical protein